MGLATIYDLKPRFQQLLRPSVATLVRRGFTANQVTLTGLALSALGGLAIGLSAGHWLSLLALPVILFVRMALNAIDGMMAREHGQASRLGALLNELSDVAADAALYLPFALIPGVSAPLIVALVTGAIITEMAGAIAPMIGASRRYDGPFGKSDRAAVFGLLAVLIALGAGGAWVNWALCAGVALTVLTTFNRCRSALRERA